jgi:hypothetical protein
VAGLKLESTYGLLPTQMPIIERESSGPLSLGTGASLQGSPMGTPVGTPTAAGASPTGYGASFKSPGFEVRKVLV